MGVIIPAHAELSTRKLWLEGTREDVAKPWSMAPSISKLRFGMSD